MPKSLQTEVDAVVIGANMRGLVTTYLLSVLGFRAVLLEKSQRLGGGDGSFVTPGGTRFDFGLHLLDEMRSEITTRLFTHIVDGQVHRVSLERAIVLRNQIMPYAPSPEQMPGELRGMLPAGDIVDDLGDTIPTRERLEACYGREFTKLIFDEVLPSYPCENRHRAFGVDAAQLLVNVYPWFFPRVSRRFDSEDESRAFHDKLRAGVEQRVLYPKQGGFAGFAEAFLRRFDSDRIEVLTGARDLDMEIEPDTHTVAEVLAKGRRFRAPHYFWAGSWTELCGRLGIPWQEVATDRVLLGSFRLNRPPITDYHEMLIGDPEHVENRIYFPARIRGSDEPLMQVEYAVPAAEGWPIDAEYWLNAWLEGTRRLGILDAGHDVVEFDFKSFCTHFNAYGVEGTPLQEADPSALRSDTNIRPIAPSLRNLNINRHVPRTIRYVTSVLAQANPI